MATVLLYTLGVGTETNIPTLFGATTHWEACQTSDGDTSYVEMAAPGGGIWTYYRDLFDIDTTAVVGTITEVMVIVSAKSGNQTNFTIAPCLRTNGTSYNGTAQNIAIGAYRTVTHAWATNPQTSATWTWDEVNALEAGVNLGGIGALSTVRASQAYVQVTYTPTAPTVTTQACTLVSLTTATGNGNITDIGGAAVTEHGHCWSTSANPTTADSKTTNGAGSAGAFTSTITDLTVGITYHTRAYATNEGGTSYGDDLEFTTVAGESGGNIAVVQTGFHYVDAYGVERYLIGTIVT